ncbi:MAG TPA: hypothetical protein VHT34_02185 [Clostridia bacterium]|nr:hypothetical protein [Clostridia bacterium]
MIRLFNKSKFRKSKGFIILILSICFILQSAAFAVTADSSNNFKYAKEDYIIMDVRYFGTVEYMPSPLDNKISREAAVATIFTFLNVKKSVLPKSEVDKIKIINPFDLRNLLLLNSLIIQISFLILLLKALSTC